jgi:protein SCO1/2
MKSPASRRRHARARRALGLAGACAVAILVVAIGLSWVTWPGAHGRDGSVGGPFRLIADDGRIVTDRSFAGKYLTIYFGYTACQDVCPATLNTLTAALARLGEKGRLVQPLFITVDPARDTPSVLRRYVANFSPVLIGLTGSPAEIEHVARAYGILALPRGADGHYVVDHSSVILLFAPDGSLVAPLPADASEMVLVQALARYVRPVT